MHLTPLRLLPMLLLGAACADETVVVDPDPPAASARDRLTSAPRQLALLPDRAEISLDVALRGAAGWQVHPTALELRWGDLELSAAPDGTLAMTAADLYFQDIAVGDKGVPPTGLHLTDVEVHTRIAHECDWVSWAADGDACSASFPAVFYLDWSMVATDGAVHPLGTQKLAPMDLWVDLGRDRDGINAAVLAIEPGPLWSWAGIVEISNLRLAAPGHEVIPLAGAE